jgi:hypothetical protein
LIVIGPAFPWGHTVKGSYPLADCSVVNGKERIDGSRLMVLRHDRGTLCLYFPRSHREEADAVLNAIGFQPTHIQVEPEVVEAPPSQIPDEPAMQLQQFSQIVQSLEPNDEEDRY